MTLFLWAPKPLFSQVKPETLLKGIKIDVDRLFMESGASPSIVIEKINLEGNKITQPGIVFREMVFSEGDSLTLNQLYEAMAESRENLLNTSLFNFVEMQLETQSFPVVAVNILFVERWYVWPFPIFELGDQNINQWISNPDWTRVNYGFYLVWENFRGRREHLKLLLRTGYRQLYTISFNQPYLNSAQTLGWILEAGYSRSRELAYSTLDNRRQFVKLTDEFAFHNRYIRTAINYRPGMRNTHTFKAAYNYFEFADTLLALNPRFSPGARQSHGFFSLAWEYKHDFRDLRAYPLNGHYFDFRVNRYGLGLLKNETMDLTTIETSVRKFWTLSPRWYFATGANTKTSMGSTKVYFNQQGLGFLGDLVRGYDNLVIDGQHFLVLKSNFKYALVPQRAGRIGFLPSEHFGLIHYALYLNLFADAGYVIDRYFFDGNPLSNTWLAGTGVGLDFVTYYDKVFRTEFSVNRQGKAGIYFHIIAPI
jgi:outer membrane protein assembly factor BamA